MNITQRIETVGAAPGVLAAFAKGEVEAIGGNLHLVNVVWFHVAGAVARRGGGSLIVSGYGTGAESALWGGNLPDVIAPAPAAQGYITERTVPFTKAQVIAFANAQWRAQGAAYTNAPDILGIEVDNMDGKSVKVSGLFWMDGGARSDRGYVIRLVDPNGLTSGANVKFEQIS